MSLLFQVLSIIVLFQLTFVSFFLLTSGKGQNLSNKLLAFFFLSLAAGLLDFILFQYEIFQTFHQYAFILNSLVIFHAPLLLLYVQSLTIRAFRLKWKHLFHASAFILSIGLLIPFYYVKSDEVQQFVIDGLKDGNATVFRVISVVGFIYEMGYLLAIKWELRNYSRAIKERYSNLENVNLNWLNYLINIFLITFLFNIVANVIRHSALERFDETAVVLSMLGMFYFINSILLKGLHQNEIFQGTRSNPPANDINLEERQHLLSKFKEVMNKEKPHLNSDLTLDDLAEIMNMSSRDLSGFINQELRQSFFDLINSYRIEEAKSRMLKNNDSKLTILEVMYEVGFNSKSSFNTAFKKYTGLTPTAFRSQNATK